VQVDKLVEADLRVASRGGDVVVGSARGGEVRVDTSCPGAGARQAGSLKVGAGAVAKGRWNAVPQAAAPALQPRVPVGLAALVQGQQRARCTCCCRCGRSAPAR
jgi:hypothetical protein